MARKAISGSVRWQIFARDNFRCRYCGVQAGEPGVALHVDHVVSVADGGTNAYDNLVTACERCNHGKYSRSLDGLPGSVDAIQASTDRAATLQAQAEAISASVKARADLRQSVVNLVGEAYRVNQFSMSEKHINRFMLLIEQHGVSSVTDWIGSACGHGVPTTDCVLYVQGIIRNLRERGEVAR